MRIFEGREKKEKRSLGHGEAKVSPALCLEAQKQGIPARVTVSAWKKERVSVGRFGRGRGNSKGLMVSVDREGDLALLAAVVMSTREERSLS